MPIFSLSLSLSPKILSDLILHRRSRRLYANWNFHFRQRPGQNVPIIEFRLPGFLSLFHTLTFFLFLSSFF